MGQESPIEPWLAPDNRAACESQNRPASLRQNDENRWQRKPKALAEQSSVPRSRNGRPEQSCSTGWAGRQEKLRPKEKSFFLDSFYRTYQVQDNFTKIVGRHSFKFGGQFHYDQINDRNFFGENGDFTFDGSETGVDFADFLLGAPASFIQ